MPAVLYGDVVIRFFLLVHLLLFFVPVKWAPQGNTPVYLAPVPVPSHLSMQNRVRRAHLSFIYVTSSLSCSLSY